MAFTYNKDLPGELNIGRVADICFASVWRPSFKERIQILFGKNIMAVFPSDPHPKNFYLMVSKQKEVKKNAKPV